MHHCSERLDSTEGRISVTHRPAIRTLDRHGQAVARSGLVEQARWWSVTVLAALVLLVAIVVVGLLAAGPGVAPGDVRIERAVQDAPVPGAAGIAATGNFLGEAAFGVPLAGFVALLLAVRRMFADAALLVFSQALRAVNDPLKQWFDSPRPTPDLVRVREFAEHNGFPSGHAMGATLLFGALAVIAARRLPAKWARAAVAAAIIAVLVVGYGRVYVGVHWPTDVLGGYLWGGALLWLAATAVRLVTERWAARTRAAGALRPRPSGDPGRGSSESRMP
jgi:undecaprenyl-diphosphatase